MTTKPRPMLGMGGKPSAIPARVAKVFSVKPWTEEGQGKKILVYSESGMGKTTLASMAPQARFIGADDGGRMIVNPKTGARISVVEGVADFRDVRDAIRQPGLFKLGETAVFDTITFIEKWAEAYAFETIKTDKGLTVDSIEGYGYGKGYKHLLDVMRLLLADMEGLVRQGTNILLLAQQSQTTVANLEGTDYLQDGPKLAANKNNSVRTEFVEWVDHVFRIGHQSVVVTRDDKRAIRGKATGSIDRVIYTRKQLHYLAKSRPVNGYTIPETVAFSQPDDDSLWKFVFEGARVEE